MAALDAVHAAEHYVALGDGLDGPWRGQVRLNDLKFGPEAHSGDRTRHDFDFRLFEIGVLAGCVKDAVQVLSLDSVGINKTKCGFVWAIAPLGKRAPA
ncbi:MAG: hypothetical protein AMXMBFR57_24860 [Acidimicrobiia bacterium]